MDIKTFNWVVTGANGNVGMALINELLQRQYYIFGIDYGTGQKLKELNDYYIYMEADLTEQKEVFRVVDEMLKRKKLIHVLVNIVGGFAMGNPVEETTRNDWDYMFNLNFQTALNCCKTTLSEMKKNGFGRIINFGSTAAQEGMVHAGPYAVSKAAVVALTKTLALEGKKHGITCNAIIPAIIDTPQNRNAMPEADFSTWTSPRAIAKTIIETVKNDKTGEMIYV